jgi:lysozyme family protein
MARATFDRAFDLVIAHEGGYVDHPKDPGGATKLGVTQKTLSAWMGRPASKADVKALTPAAVMPIYRKQYWDAVRGDDLPAGLDYAVFDYAVNSGPGRAARDLQRTLRVAADGVIGAMTLDAAHKAAERDEWELIRALCERRMAYLRRLKTFPVFGRGWTRRVLGEHPGAQDGDIGVIDYATKIARADFTYGLPKVASIGKARPEDLKGEIQPTKAMQAGLIGGGVAGETVLNQVTYLQWLGDSPIVQTIIVGMVLLGIGLILWELIKGKRQPVEAY